jgi:hypothetical protein
MRSLKAFAVVCLFAATALLLAAAEPDLAYTIARFR